MNGGRDNVRMSYGNYLPNGDDEGDWTNTTFYQYYRFWNDAQEAYINMGNYRVSYFLNDINKGFYVPAVLLRILSYLTMIDSIIILYTMYIK